MIRLAPLLLLALGGCAAGQLDCADLRQGACKVSFQRFLTDTSATFEGPDGLGFTYGSNPNAAATAEAFAAINRLAGLVGTVAVARPPTPAPAAPQEVDPDARPENPDEMAYSGARRRAFTRIGVSAEAPRMIDGVAHAPGL
jgi:hypothetical protein